MVIGAARASTAQAAGLQPVARPPRCDGASGSHRATPDRRRPVDPHAGAASGIDTDSSPGSRQAASRPVRRVVAVARSSGRISVRLVPARPAPDPRSHSGADRRGAVQALHPRWRRLPEVGVTRPARGFVDAVARATAGRPRRRDQVESRSAPRAAATMGARQGRVAAIVGGMALMAPARRPRPVISRLLILRSTRSTRTSRGRSRQHAHRVPALARADVHAAIATATRRGPAAGCCGRMSRPARARISRIDHPGASGARR